MGEKIITFIISRYSSLSWEKIRRLCKSHDMDLPEINSFEELTSILDMARRGWHPHILIIPIKKAGYSFYLSLLYTPHRLQSSLCFSAFPLNFSIPCIYVALYLYGCRWILLDTMYEKVHMIAIVTFVIFFMGWGLVRTLTLVHTTQITHRRKRVLYSTALYGFSSLPLDFSIPCIRVELFMYTCR